MTQTEAALSIIKHGGKCFGVGVPNVKCDECPHMGDNPKDTCKTVFHKTEYDSIKAALKLSYLFLLKNWKEAK